MNIQTIFWPQKAKEMQTTTKDQFRATRVWNKIVTVFREELPLRRHRKGLQRFDNCFSGYEAVSWTLNYLEENSRSLLEENLSQFGLQCVNTTQNGLFTREKVTLLLQKFVEQKIIGDVRRKGDIIFEDSPNQFYSFNRENVASFRSFHVTRENGSHLNNCNCREKFELNVSELSS